MRGEITMREIQPGHVQTGTNEALQHFCRIGSRANSSDDFRFVIREIHICFSSQHTRLGRQTFGGCWRKLQAPACTVSLSIQPKISPFPSLMASTQKREGSRSLDCASYKCRIGILMNDAFPENNGSRFFRTLILGAALLAFTSLRARAHQGEPPTSSKQQALGLAAVQQMV